MSAVPTAVYSTINASLFARFLANDAAEPLLAVAAEHSLLPGSAFADAGALPSAPVDVAIVVAPPESVLTSVAGLLGGAPCDPQTLRDEVDAFAAAVSALPARLVLVATWVVPRRYSGGVLALDERWGLDGAVGAANARLLARLRETGTRHALNAAGWQATLGERAHSAKNRYLTHDPYAFDFWKLAVAEVKAALASFGGAAKKLVVLDLDNTLWGGEVGDGGAESLRLGGHDPVGEAFVAFQRELLALRRRGVLLAVASKNDAAIALAALDGHPEQVIRSGDLAGWAIDWNDKGYNVGMLCERLGIAAADTVFIDDNPAERGAVAAALPGITVPDWPANPLLYVDALRRIDLFDVPFVTDEDLARARTYAATRSLRAGVPHDRVTRVDVRPLSAADAPRALQLLNKTNQMNLTTRRFTATDLQPWLAQTDRAAWVVRVADEYADYGLTGAFALQFEGAVCTVTDLVMSCRVMGRGVEKRMLERAMDEARARGCVRVEAWFVPTQRNEPMRRFLAERSGLTDGGDGCFSAGLDARVPA